MLAEVASKKQSAASLTKYLDAGGAYDLRQAETLRKKACDLLGLTYEEISV